MSETNKYQEELLSTINETQKTLDEIFINIDSKTVSELNLGLALISLRSARRSIQDAKNDVARAETEGSE